VASEIHKSRAHRGLSPHLFHFRDNKGLGVDVIVERGEEVVGVQCRAGATVVPDFFRSLEAFGELVRSREPSLRPVLRIVYGGDQGQRRSTARVVPWREIPDLEW